MTNVGELDARPPVSRVLYSASQELDVEWRSSIWSDGYPSLLATYPETARDEPLSPYLVLLRAGLAQPAGHPTAGALLPHHLTLTAARHRKEVNGERVGGMFLCAFRQVTLPGSYPAPCPVEPGLSSILERLNDIQERDRPAAWQVSVYRAIGPAQRRSKASLAIASARWLRCRRTCVAWNVSRLSASADN